MRVGPALEIRQERRTTKVDEAPPVSGRAFGAPNLAPVEGHHAIAELQALRVHAHGLRRDAGCAQCAGQTERRQAHAAGSDKRHGVSERPIRIEHEQVVPEPGHGGRQIRIRRKDHTALGDAFPGRHKPRIGNGGHLGVALECRIREHQDVAGLADRVGKRRVGFGAGPRGSREGESEARVRVREVDVVQDHRRRRAREVVEQARVHDARPGPSSGERLEVAERVLVDLDEDDILTRGRGSRGRDQPPVVGAHLDGLEQAGPGAAAREDVEAEHKRCGAKPDERACDSFAHDQIRTLARSRAAAVAGKALAPGAAQGAGSRTPRHVTRIVVASRLHACTARARNAFRLGA